MPQDAKKNFPQPSIRRLPGYLRLLRQLRRDGGNQVSCTHIARELGLDSTQVRKDLALTGISGKPRVGYALDPLVEAIERFLGWNRRNEAVLIGAGSLGRALMRYEFFNDYGLSIVAAFDNDPDKAGETVRGCPIFPLQSLPEKMLSLKAPMGILTVPAPAAQESAELLVKNGVVAIWNFAPAKLDLSPSIAVENVELISSLAVLTVNMPAIPSK